MKNFFKNYCKRVQIISWSWSSDFKIFIHPILNHIVIKQKLKVMHRIYLEIEILILIEVYLEIDIQTIFFCCCKNESISLLKLFCYKINESEIHSPKIKSNIFFLRCGEHT